MIEVDRDLLQAFEKQLDPAAPCKGKIPIKILGYGEISTVFVLAGQETLTYKRLPVFRNPQALRDYQRLIEDYGNILRGLGIRVVESRCAAIATTDGRRVLYLVQRRLASEAIGNHLLRCCSRAQIVTLLTRVLDNILSVWHKNDRDDPRERIGLDSQISNWAFPEFVSQGDATPWYFDIGTPLIRRAGREALNTVVLLESMPPLVATIARRLFLAEILDRYYDVRAVALDLVANFYKEGRADCIPVALETINHYLKERCPNLNIRELDCREIARYYARDALIWRMLLYLRRLHRFVTRRVLGRRYDFILPGKIKRG